MVEILTGFGHTHDQIADALGITGKTLRRHFRRELQSNGARPRALVTIAIYKAAVGGSAAAQRLWLTQVAGSMPLTPRKAPAAPPPGKKEKANDEAITAAENTSWADLVRH